MDTSHRDSESLGKGLLSGKQKKSFLLTLGGVSAVVLIIFYLIISSVINSRIDSKNQDMTTEITALRTQVTSLQTTVTTLTAQVATLNANVNALTDQVNDMSTTVVTFNNRLDADETDIENLKTTTTTQGTQITTLNTNVGTLQTNYNALKTQVQGDEADINTLQDTVTTQGDSITALQTTTGDQATQITDLTNDLNTLQQSTTTNFGTVNTRVDTLNTTLNTNVQNINAYVQPNYNSIVFTESTFTLNNFDPKTSTYTNILTTGIKLTVSQDKAYGVCSFTVFSETTCPGAQFSCHLYVAALLNEGNTPASDYASFAYGADLPIPFTTSFQIPQGTTSLNFGIGMDGLTAALPFDLQIFDGYCNFYGATSS